ncbi:MAG: ABC transporter permease [Aggregatilineales bacterium]
MLGYIIRRILYLIPVFIFVTLITFVLMHTVPGGPWDTATAKPASPAIKNAIKAKFHLNEPLPQQYIEYLWEAAHGDLGPSFSESRTVNQVIAQGFPYTARIGLIALFLALVIGIPLGVLAALKHNSIIDQISLFLVTIGISVPSFVSAIAAILIFSLVLNLLPFQFQDGNWSSWIMPAVILALAPMALMVRLTRSATLDVLGEDYVRTARAKGLSSFTINIRHVLRNALIPVITLVGPLTAGLITGSFVVETFFGVPGIGRMFVQSVEKRDYGQLMGTTLFYTLLIVLFNLAVDLTYSFIDPRITRS